MKESLWKERTMPNDLLAICLIVVTHLAGTMQAQAPVDARSILAEAQAATQRLTDDFQRGEILNRIGTAMARTGDLARAVEIANLAYPHSSSALFAVGEQLATAGNPQQAGELTARIRGGSASTVFFAMAQRLAQSGQVDQALQTAPQISAPEVRAGALRAIAREQARRGDTAGAQKTLALAPPPARPSPVDDATAIMLEASIERGDQSAVREAVSRMPADARTSVMIGVVMTFIERGDRTNANRWLDDLLRESETSADGYVVRYFAIPASVKLSHIDRAMKVAADLPEDFRLKGYTAVAVTCAETHDLTCVNTALDRIAAPRSPRAESDVSDFQAKMMLLNVSAALIVAGEYDTATRLLTRVESGLDEIGRISLEPQAQTMRVVTLALQGKFDEARTIALKIKPDSVADDLRGRAIRTIAALQTRGGGPASSRTWALSLTELSDRASALLGTAQAILGIDDVKLPYSAIFVH